MHYFAQLLFYFLFVVRPDVSIGKIKCGSLQVSCQYGQLQCPARDFTLFSSVGAHAFFEVSPAGGETALHLAGSNY
jgi:hypothetical protein